MIVKIHSWIQNKSEKRSVSFEGKGILNKQVLSFVENENHNELRLENNKITLRRRINHTEEFYFTFLEQEYTTLEYTGSVGKLEIPLYTEQIVHEDGKIEINYILNEQEEFSFKITYEM